MPKQLSDDQVEAYRGDGGLFPVTIMSEAAAAEHRRRLEAAEAVHGNMHYRSKPYLLFSSAKEIAGNAALLDAVEDILGPDILLWNSAYVIKEARDQRYVSWHQDLTYWGLDSDQLVTAWVALTPAKPDIGGMRFVPGSHLNGAYDHHDTHAADNILHRGQKVFLCRLAAADDQNLVDLEAEVRGQGDHLPFGLVDGVGNPARLPQLPATPGGENHQQGGQGPPDLAAAP